MNKCAECGRPTVWMHDVDLGYPVRACPDCEDQVPLPFDWDDFDGMDEEDDLPF